MARKLRIAVSVFFGVVAVALSVLSVMSYWQFGLLRIGTSNSIALVDGHWLVNDVCNINPNPSAAGGLIIVRDFAGGSIHTWSGPQNALLQVGVGTRIRAWPFWAIAAALSAAPWIRPHFSLRTLLIATTLVAVVLGLGVWLAS